MNERVNKAQMHLKEKYPDFKTLEKAITRIEFAHSKTPLLGVADKQGRRGAHKKKNPPLVLKSFGFFLIEKDGEVMVHIEDVPHKHIFEIQVEERIANLMKKAGERGDAHSWVVHRTKDDRLVAAVKVTEQNFMNSKIVINSIIQTAMETHAISQDEGVVMAEMVKNHGQPVIHV